MRFLAKIATRLSGSQRQEDLANAETCNLVELVGPQISEQDCLTFCNEFRELTDRMRILPTTLTSLVKDALICRSIDDVTVYKNAFTHQNQLRREARHCNEFIGSLDIEIAQYETTGHIRWLVRNCFGLLCTIQGLGELLNNTASVLHRLEKNVTESFVNYKLNADSEIATDTRTSRELVAMKKILKRISHLKSVDLSQLDALCRGKAFGVPFRACTAILYTEKAKKELNTFALFLVKMFPDAPMDHRSVDLFLRNLKIYLIHTATDGGRYPVKSSDALFHEFLLVLPLLKSGLAVVGMHHPNANMCHSVRDVFVYKLAEKIRRGLAPRARLSSCFDRLAIYRHYCDITDRYRAFLWWPARRVYQNCAKKAKTIEISAYKIVLDLVACLADLEDEDAKRRFKEGLAEFISVAAAL